MTCRDCIHCNACHEMYLVAVSAEDDFFERNDAETCEDFKNKADFVEVVRCKNCKHYQYTDYEGCYSYCKLLTNKAGYSDEMVDMKPNDFCSYGERK